MPDAVIGDMDSISPKTRAQIAPDRLHEVADQDNTDFDKCLTHIDAPLILAEGFAGGRLDHQLAAFTTLAAFPDQKVVLMSEHDACFLAPEALDLALPEGTRLSLFPMGPLTGEGEGLEYPIDGLDFAPAGRIGTSNMVTGPVRLRFDARHMLVIVPRAQVDPVIAALAPGLGF